MWSRIWGSLKSNFPLIVLIIVLGVITWINYPWGSSLLGWDSVQLELDFRINLRRALTSVWVGNQGVGHIGGHGYATILIQGMIEWIISLAVGVAHTRGVFIFSMLWLGPIGIYFLWKKWLKNTGIFASWGAMLSGLFYLLNLGTVQVFFAPLEAFVIFYGLLPWAILSIINYLSESSRRNLIWLLVTQVIFSMIGFIPPQFIAYGMMVLALLIGHMVEKRRDLVEGFKKATTVGVILLMVNLYWLAPVAYYSVHGASSYAEAKNNQVSTPDFQYMSEARGKWSDVALMRGFFIDSSDSVIKGEGKFFEIFEPWNNYLQNIVEWVGYGLFIVSMLGLLVLLVKRGKRSLGLSMLLVLGIGWVAIAQAEEPFTTVANLMHNIPVVGQAFRAAFTKFVGLLIFVYAIGFGYGIFVIYKLLREKLVVGIVLVSIGVGSLIFYVWPMFRGNLIYERMKITMPIEYGQAMKFLKNQDKSSRIAYLPSAWMWGWQVHEWGYSGSGFLWYGIEQPILDRAFDVWSPYNEGFYNEFSTALYGGSNERVSQVLDKYDVRYVLLDESVIVPGQDKEILRIEQTKRIAEELGWEQKFKEGFLTVWETSPTVLHAEFVSAPETYTLAEGETVKAREDVIFDDHGSYVSGMGGARYPFASLMRENPTSSTTSLGAGKLEVVEWGEGIVTLRSDLVGSDKDLQPTRSDLGEQKLIIPGWEVGEIVRVDFKDNEAIPTYFVNGAPGPRFLGKEVPKEGESHIFAKVSEGEEWEEYRREQVFSIENNVLSIEVKGEPFVYDFAKQGQGSIGNCDVLKRGVATKTGSTYYADSRGAVCDYVVMELPFTRLPYLLRLRGENYEGRSIKFFLYNTGSKRNDIEYLLGKNKFDQTFTLLPWEWDGYYTLNIETRSFGQVARNRIDPVVGQYVPLDKFARAVLVASQQADNLRIKNDLDISYVKKTGTWLYGVGSRGAGLLRLSQRYDAGWVGLLVDSEKLKVDKLNHVKVDGWANGWILPQAQDKLDESQIVVIFYWPQLLQYLGYVLLGVTLLVILIPKRAR